MTASLKQLAATLSILQRPLPETVAIEKAIAEARAWDACASVTIDGVKVDVFPDDKPSDVRHRLRAEEHDQGVER